MNGIPDKISGFNVYNSGSRLVGVTDEVTLPDFDSMTTTVSGAGILGEYESPNPGHFSSMVLEIPLRTISSEFTELAAPVMQTLTLRGSIQGISVSGGDIFEQSLKITVRGMTKTRKSGKVKAGEPMEASATVELVYIKIEVDGRTVIELDKLNYIFKVGGKDYLAAVRRNI